MGYNMPPVVKVLLILNIGIYIFGDALVNGALSEYFALFNILGNRFQPYQLLTHMFLHANFSHILGNMIGLFFFGPLVEMRLGTQRFIFFYLATGMLAGLLYAGLDAYDQQPKLTALEELVNTKPAPSSDQMIGFFENEGRSLRLKADYLDFVYEEYPANPQDPARQDYAASSVQRIYSSMQEQINNMRMVGASGAVFGILMTVALLFPNVEVRLLFFPFFPIKMKYLVTVYGFYEFYGLVQSSPEDNVAHFAHLAGMLVAFLLIRYWRLKPML